MSVKDFFDGLFGFFFPPPPPPAKPSIAEIASTNGNFDILVAALDTAGLTDTFANPGDFTVFAPTDEAFTTLAASLGCTPAPGSADPEGDVATFLVGALNGISPTALTDVLLYHVQDGAATLDELTDTGAASTKLGPEITVANGTLFDADPDGENPEFVEGLTDIHASNGIIQVIDRVLLPIDLPQILGDTIADVAIANPDFDVLEDALLAVDALPDTDLVAALSDRNSEFTVFAPTDDAFRDLLETLGVDTGALSDDDLAGALLTALGENAAQVVKDVLLYHVAEGSPSLDALKDQVVVKTLGGADRKAHRRT